MLNSIPVFSPQDATLFLRYFSGVAQALARRFSLGFHPDEEHLTSLLCELFDDRGSTLHSLEYDVSDLNQGLQDSGSLLQASISLETTGYTKHQERHATQADIGLILEYTDHVDYSNSFRKGMLVQAKKLFPSSDTKSKYSLSSRYSSFDASQHERLSKLRNYYEKQGHKSGDAREREMLHRDVGIASSIQYLLYNPPFRVLPKDEQEYVLHRQLARESNRIYDYTQGLCLYTALTEPDGLRVMLDLSSLFGELDVVHSLAEEAATSGRSKEELAAFDLRSVIDSVDIRDKSFAWFLVFNFISGNVGSRLPEFVDLVTGCDPGMSKKFGIGIPRFLLRVGVVAGSSTEQ